MFVVPGAGDVVVSKLGKGPHTHEATRNHSALGDVADKRGAQMKAITQAATPHRERDFRKGQASAACSAGLRT